ncbi:aldehyde dehydrogenase family protein [Leekyejoonella antrihumi]|uniref:Aldehyde dehydrogenase family protein n=1 Tax=Leekyejoonella antrihumi TaxID=1660198 RepID=A0A563DRT7_9MICO|nr:aldehyde dehydrogenase family protein [Leekyejoonella antrihumi]TWP32683.1 aldehyde dehydrogenase family protein [Leekyejoonella antrihumi]
MTVDTARAGHMLEQAHWAARGYSTFDAATVQRIVAAVADVAYANSQRYAEWAVQETEMGVVADKVRKNQACSKGLLEFYAGQDFVSPRVQVQQKMVQIPRPAGVVLAITPTTNPVASVYFKVLLSLMTRNAVVVAPHPRAKECCADAAGLLGRAAEEAGAPIGIVQVVDEPSIPLLTALMKDERTDVIVATGGSDVVRAAYSSGNPALGVGPGNVPVMVDHTADLKAAAERIVASKAFDNSVLCTNESVLVVEESVSSQLERAMAHAGAHVLDQESTDRLRSYMFFGGHLNTDVVGKDASWIAEQAGFRVTAKTRLLVAPIESVLPDDPMTHEKLSPVLALVRVPDVQRGIGACRAVVRIAGAGHSAAIHSEDPRTIMAFTAGVPVLRVAVNIGASTGCSGLGTNLAPSMTIGTGFVGGSSIGDNLEPAHLLNWAKIAYNADISAPMDSFAGLDPAHAPSGRTPAYPMASNATHSSISASALGARVEAAVSSRLPHGATEQFRDEIRQLVAEELSQLLKG